MGRNNAINNTGLAFTASTFMKAGSYVEGVQLTTADVVTGLTISSATIAADGTDPNIDITLTPKNTGRTIASTGITVTTGGILSTGAVTLNGGVVGIGTDVATNTINIGTAGARTVAIGNSTGATGASVSAGSGGLGLTTNNSIIAMNSGTGNISISDDSTATALNIGVGAGAKAIVLGSTNSTSSLALQTGTVGLSVASGSGTTMTLSAAGYAALPFQPLVLARKTSNSTNATGDNTPFTVICDSALKNIGTVYNTSTGVFTAPVAGTYYFYGQVLITGNTLITNATIKLVTTARTYQWQTLLNEITYDISAFAVMALNDTATLTIQTTDTAGKVDVVNGDATAMNTYFCAFLLPSA